MKKLLLFILLKILEIGGIVYIPYWFGLLSKKIMPKTFITGVVWVDGFCFVLMVVLTVLILITALIGIAKFINFNWKIVNGGKSARWYYNLFG